MTTANTVSTLSIADLSDYELISDAHGQIKTLFMSYFQAGADGTQQQLLYLVDFLTKMDTDVEFIIIVSSSVADELESYLQANVSKPADKITYVPYDTNEVTPWMRDPFSVFLAKGAQTPRHMLLLPYIVDGQEPHGEDDNLVAAQLAANDAQTFGVLQADDLVFMGGNIIKGDDFVMVGGDAVVDSELGTNKLSPEEILAIYQKYFGHHLTVYPIEISAQVQSVGSIKSSDGYNNYLHYDPADVNANQSPNTQPVFHMDMFVTLAGRLPDNTLQVMVGNPVVPDYGDDALTPVMQKFADYTSGLIEQVFSSFESQFDGTIQRYDIPMPLIYTEPMENLRYWYFASYNNGLVEYVKSNPELNRVFMPTYGADTPALATYDQQASQAWENINYQVITLIDYTPYAQLSGAAHCITNVFRREEPQ